jgi:hypothetical protein
MFVHIVVVLVVVVVVVVIITYTRVHETTIRDREYAASDSRRNQRGVQDPRSH